MPTAAPAAPALPVAPALRSPLRAGLVVGVPFLIASATIAAPPSVSAGLGLGLFHVLPWIALAVTLALGDVVARRVPPLGELCLLAAAVLGALSAGALAFGLGLLDHAALRPTCPCGADGLFGLLARHPVEAVLGGAWWAGAWVVVGGRRLARPQARGAQWVAALVAGNFLVACAWSLDLIQSPWRLVALASLPLLLTWPLAGHAIPGPTRRGRAALVGASWVAFLLLTRVGPLAAPWRGYQLRTRGDAPEVRLDAATLLPTLGQPALAALTQALAADVPEPARDLAARALGELGDPRAVPTLLEALQTLRDPEPAHRAIGRLGGVQPADYPALVRLVRASRGARYARPARVGPRPPRELPQLFQRLLTETPAVTSWLTYDIGLLPRDDACLLLGRAALQVPYHPDRNGMAAAKLRELLPANAPADLRAHVGLGWSGRWRPRLVARRLRATPGCAPLLRDALDDDGLDERLAALALLSRADPRRPWTWARPLAALGSQRAGLAPID